MGPPSASWCVSHSSVRKRRSEYSGLLQVVSDTHNMHDRCEVPEGDVLIHCGDFTNKGTLKEMQVAT